MGMEYIVWILLSVVDLVICLGSDGTVPALQLSAKAKHHSWSVQGVKGHLERLADDNNATERCAGGSSCSIFFWRFWDGTESGPETIYCMGQRYALFHYRDIQKNRIALHKWRKLLEGVYFERGLQGVEPDKAFLTFTNAGRVAWLVENKYT